ncbi:MAG: fluoride efflux transporter CrcB [Chloroflexota bacterium]|nr:fluoride efflux transporter CrcB [Chloroflexota bacterium]
MSQVLWVGVGGFVGSICRFLLIEMIRGWTNGAAFPYWTLAVNVIGCLIIGILSRLAETNALFTPDVRAFVFVGVLGGFTTFSTFSSETMALVRAGDLMSACVNTAAHLLLGFGAVWLGRLLASGG